MNKNLFLICVLFSIIYSIFGQIPISTIEELQKIGNDPTYPLNGSYILVNDIEASATKSWNNGKGFDPIGDAFHEFTGTFDGNNKTISNLYINRPDETMIGLFSNLFNSRIKNIFLLNCIIIGKNKVGAIAGVGSGILANCHISGDVRSIEWKVGGITGTSGTIKYCSYKGKIFGGIGLIGGLMGEYGVIENSNSCADINGSSYVGGLMGGSGGIYNSYSCSNVTGVDYVGGLFGKGGGAENCYSTGRLIGQNYVGGLGGINYGVVKNCYSTGPTSGTKYVSGLLGVAIADYTARVEDSFFDINTTSQDDGHYRGRTTDEMMNPETFKNWDFQNVWWMIPGKTYPLLKPVKFVGIKIQPMQDYGLPAEFKISFNEPVRGLTFDDVDFSTSTAQGIQGTLTPDDAPTTITAWDCFTEMLPKNWTTG